jgi:ADP-ribose pyrophosphatase YjhB (NUDIX family)
MIEPWSDEEREVSIKIFRKIAANNRAWLAAWRSGTTPADYPMPTDVYEAHRLTVKSISSDIAVFDERGRVLLAQRPSLEENPAELWPSLWHLPGTRHIAGESDEEALNRLFAMEIGVKLEARFVGHREYFPQTHTLVYTTQVQAGDIQTNEKKAWFDPSALPATMVSEQRPILEELSNA